VHQHYFEVGVKAENPLDPLADAEAWRVVHAVELGRDDVEVHAMTSCKGGSVLTQRNVGRTIDEQESPRASQTSSEICEPAGAVR
jgi:hypothetical protein